MHIQNSKIELNNGDNSHLFDLIGEKWGIVFFFRGVWCTICKKQLKEFQENYSEFEKLNTQIIAISNDTKFKSKLAEDFFKLSFHVISDKDLKIIEPHRLKTEFKGKITSKPAVFVLNPKKETVFEFIGKNYDDRFTIKDIISKLKQLQS